LRTIRLIGIYQLSAIYLKNAFDFSGKASRAKQAPQRAPLPKVGSPFKHHRNFSKAGKERWIFSDPDNTRKRMLRSPAYVPLTTQQNANTRIRLMASKLRYFTG
jgi:hypothetical protein